MSLQARTTRDEALKRKRQKLRYPKTSNNFLSYLIPGPLQASAPQGLALIRCTRPVLLLVRLSNHPKAHCHICGSLDLHRQVQSGDELLKASVQNDELLPRPFVGLMWWWWHACSPHAGFWKLSNAPSPISGVYLCSSSPLLKLFGQPSYPRNYSSLRSRPRVPCNVVLHLAAK